MPANVKEILTAYEAGKYLIRSWRKVPSVSTSTAVWFDFSMSPGNPVPQYYAQTPLTATVLARSTDGGLDHGPNVSSVSATKYLRRFQTSSVNSAFAPCPFYICDYLLFYPFVSMDVGTQDLVNTNTLTRHTDGAGVKVMAVVVASQVGGSTFRIIYTNQDGTSGRTSPTITTNTQGANGTIMTSPVQSGSLSSGLSGPFMPLEGNDTGVRSNEQVEFMTGDVGLLALVLVKPLASHSHFDVTAPTEVDFLINQNIMPVIKDDAYLNLIGYPAATVASNVLIGLIETVWI